MMNLIWKMNSEGRLAGTWVDDNARRGQKQVAQQVHDNRPKASRTARKAA